MNNEKLHHIKLTAEDAAKIYGDEWESALVGDPAGNFHAIVSEKTEDVVVRAADASHHSSWLCDYLEAISPKSVIPLIDELLTRRTASSATVPDVDEYAYDLARQIMQLVAQTHVGGLTQLQAKIQCLIAKTAAPATAPAPVPDWSQAERRDCTSCGSEGVSTLHYNGEPVCYGCWPTEPAPAPAPLDSFEGATFFSYGTESGYEEHQTAEKAKEAAETDIDDYRGDACDGWSDEVAHIVWGVVLERSTQTGLRKRTDEDSCDSSLQEICDYELRPDFTPAPATTEKPFKDVAPNDVVPVGNDFFRVRYVTHHGDDTTLHLQREAEKLSPYTQNDVIHLSVANAVSLMTKVKAAGGKVAE